MGWLNIYVNVYILARTLGWLHVSVNSHVNQDLCWSDVSISCFVL